MSDELGMEAPIIVCGPARGGTTAAATMLNRHPDIAITGEVPLERLPSMKTLLGEIASYQPAVWTPDRRAEVVRLLWYAVSAKEKPNARRWGMKTPYAELEAAAYWNTLLEPLYVYSLRRGDRVFQSRIRLGWIDVEPARLLARYKRSIKRFERLRAEGRALLVQVDLVAGSDDRRRMAEEVFAFVGESVDKDLLDAIADDDTRVSNPTSKPGEEPQLPDEWQHLLDSDDEYQELMARFYPETASVQR